MCSRYAASGSEVAEGGVDGREFHIDRSSGGREDIAVRRAGECRGEEGKGVLGKEGVGEDGRDGEGEGASEVGSLDSRFGNSRCWIQYEVPPTMIGTCFLLCVSSIYAT